MRHYILIGSGIAGLAAAEVLRQHDASASITLIAEETHHFYSRPGLAYLLTGVIPEKQLYVRTPAEVSGLRLNWIRARAARFYPQDHQVILANSQRLTFDRLLLATGSTAVPPDFPGGDLKGVVKLDNLDDARHILKLAQRGRTAVVVGGGITALELVEGFRARGMRVHYLMRGERYWSGVLDETESRIIQDRLEAEGVSVHYRTQVKQAIGKRGTLVGVETTTGEYIACQVLGIAIGVRPRIELALQAGLKSERGILVNEFLETSAPDVYAAGDVAQVHDPRSGRAVLDTLWSSALAQGQVAGANMTGAQTTYHKQVALNVTRLAGLTTTLIGAVGTGHGEDLVSIARGDSESWRITPEAWVVTDEHEVNRIRLLVGQHSLVGGLVMGDQTLSRLLYDLIAAQADITSIREALQANPASAIELVQNFHQQWKSANHAPNL
jgi:NADPH-dependent 2,4-dienoyl-CoA reductase/sulfur reductase-like enzyme